MNSLEVAYRLKTFLDQMATSDSLVSDARYALRKDSEYIQKSIAILSSENSDAINELWREVQYLSRFFGGDYAQGLNQTTLLQLMDQFEAALLEDIVCLRRTQS